jgi:hypothetical protein
MADAEWESLWNAVASHPTLNTVILECYHRLPESESTRQMRNQVMMQAIRSNTVLCELEYRGGPNNYRQDVEEELARPVLELNRFRPHVQAIQREPNAAIRERLFTETLLGDQVHKSSSHGFLLARENPDLLVQLSCCRERMPSSSTSSEMPLPTREASLVLGKRKR